MRVIESGKISTPAPASDGLLFTEQDRPNGQACLDTKEFNILSKMMQAVDEERYDEAGKLCSSLYIHNVHFISGYITYCYDWWPSI